jgi:sec-independent protein translocase protein TatA
MLLAFGFGSPADWALIFIIALVVFGPKRLPEIGQQLGRAYRELRKVTDEFTGAAHSVRDEFESALRPDHQPATRPAKTMVYDQPSDDPMAPAHSERVAPGLVLSTVPPEAKADDGKAEKGH